MRDSRAWSTKDVIRVAATVAGVYVALKLLWATADILLLTFLGVLIGLALSAGVDQLQRLRVPRVVGAVAIVLVIAALFIGVGRLIAPTIGAQWRQVTRELPAVVERAREWLSARPGGIVGALTRPAPEVRPAEPQGGEVEARRSPLVDQVTEPFGEIGRRFFAIFSSTLAALAGLLLVLFVALYVAIEPRLYEQGILHLVPHSVRPHARELLARVAHMLRRWLLAQSIAMVTVGALTTGVLTLLDVKGAVALGLIAGLLEFVPFAGPILASVPAIGMALLDSPEKAFYVALAFIGVQQAEAQVITPLLMKEGLELPPVLTIVGQTVMAAVFGFVGLLVAVPLLGATLVTVKMLYVRDVIGDAVEIPGEPTASSS